MVLKARRPDEIIQEGEKLAESSVPKAPKIEGWDSI